MKHSNQGKTAILIFANSSKEELKHKPIVNGKKLFDTLTGIAIKTAEETGLPYFHFSEKEQVGSSFGERFTNAIQAIFNKEYEHVIAIGNDSPKLKTSHILEANQQLKEHKFVIGPSLDGGFYLMGVNKQHFNLNLFKNLPWQTANIRKSLLKITTSIHKVEVTFLPILLDIDSVQDVKHIVDDTFASVLPKELFKILLLLVQFIRTKSTHVFLILITFKNSIFFNKGSPQYFTLKFQ